MIVLHLWQESRWIIFTTSKNGLENCHLHSCEMPFMMLEELQKVIKPMYTVFENHRKSSIQHCKRSTLRLHLVTLFYLKFQVFRYILAQMDHFWYFWLSFGDFFCKFLPKLVGMMIRAIMWVWHGERLFATLVIILSGVCQSMHRILIWQYCGSWNWT